MIQCGALRGGCNPGDHHAYALFLDIFPELALFPLHIHPPHDSPAR